MSYVAVWLELFMGKQKKRAAVVRIQSGKWQACSPQEDSSDEALLPETLLWPTDFIQNHFWSLNLFCKDDMPFRKPVS